MVGSRSALGTALCWYQKKIGSYDQQLWEKSIEERVLRGLSHAIPKKLARIKTELIDLDLIRGSAFTKAKPQQSCLATTYLGIVRVSLFPFFLKWWADQTNSLICSVLFTLYMLQVSSMYIFFNGDYSQFNGVGKAVDPIPASEVLTPLVMFFILGAMQSQIASSHLAISKPRRRGHIHRQPPAQPTTKRTRRRKKLSKRAGLNAALDDEEDKENILRSDSKVEPIINPVLKKASDEESGLDSMEYTEVKRSRSASLSANQRRATYKVGNLDSLGESDLSLAPSRRNSLPKTEKESVSGDEADRDVGDFSSLDDCSPYSTINSATDSQWRRYSDMVAERVRTKQTTLSPRRFSVSEDKLLKRSRVLLNAEVTNVQQKQKQTPCDHHSRKPTLPNLHLKLPAKENRDPTCPKCYSSCDSEGSISPTTPAKGVTSDLEWPLINSDNTSEDEDIEDDVDDEEEVILPPTGDYFMYPEEPHSCEDPDSLPPPLFSFADDSFVGIGPRNENRSNDTGQRSLKVSCNIWQQNECQKVDLSVLDIGSAIIRKVDFVKHSNEYFYMAIVFSLVLAFIPCLFRVQLNVLSSSESASAAVGPLNIHNESIVSIEVIDFLNQLPVLGKDAIIETVVASGSTWFRLYIIVVSLLERFCLSLLYFFLLCVAERTFKERFLYAKYFCHLTSSRRARRSELPHFRLNKVRNIKTWLSIRSYLKKHGPQRSVDVIVSTSFILAVCILTFLCIQLSLKSFSGSKKTEKPRLPYPCLKLVAKCFLPLPSPTCPQLLRESDNISGKLYCWEMVSWNLAIGLFIMRLIILGSKMNKKYRGNLSVLITEQINLYLQLEQKPHKKEELTLANHVLKLAADLLKQLEAPFKISGFSANPYLYNITKVVVLSAFSAVLSELLGFKLKLYKIKLG